MATGSIRICLVALGFPPEVGGTEHYNAEYARRLYARGHDVRVFAWADPPGEAERECDRALPFEVHREPRVLAGRALEPGSLARVLDAWRPEVILVSRASVRLSRVVPLVARHGPLVISVHELGGRHLGRGAFGRSLVRRRYGFDRARRVLVNSENTRGRILALRVPPERVTVVHPGVDTAAFAPPPDEGRRARRELGLEGHLVLLTVARLSANKGHARVMDALPALRARFPTLVYVVVGDGEEAQALERHARDRGVADIVRFEGLVPDPRPYYHAAHVFVMPSGRPTYKRTKAAEGFGMSYVEAAACGLPAVASSDGGGPEVVVDRQTGRLVDPNDPDALGSVLGDLLEDPAACRRLGQAARKHCERFDWERGTDALEGVLRECAGPPGPGDAGRAASRRQLAVRTASGPARPVRPRRWRR